MRAALLTLLLAAQGAGADTFACTAIEYCSWLLNMEDPDCGPATARFEIETRGDDAIVRQGDRAYVMSRDRTLDGGGTLYFPAPEEPSSRLYLALGPGERFTFGSPESVHHGRCTAPAGE